MQVTADDIARLLASRPPRQVPDHVLKAAKGGKGIWVLVLFGLFFGTFGMLFVWLFFPWNFVDELRLGGASIPQVPGIVREAKETGMSVNKARVVEYRFSYTPEGGPAREAVCYAIRQNWSPGSEVAVRYLPGKPQVALIDGANLNQGGLTGAFTIIFPLIGYGLVAGVLLFRSDPGRLLREGLMAEVDVLSIERTNMTVNDRTVYRLTVSAPGRAGSGSVAIRRTDFRDLELARRHLEQKQPVFVLYDPRKPAKMIFPEALLDK
ncbi:MAG TPA: DUF3592 domain-containing protein [Lacunisphaera sp.]|nr:DUF3592 domain-containing protein [Lacunisphaera sp.]